MNRIVTFLEDPIGFFMFLLTIAGVAFLRALSNGATLLKSAALAAVNFVLCGSAGAILIFQFGIHPFAACGFCGVLSLVSERVLKSVERLVGVAEKRAANEIMEHHHEKHKKSEGEKPVEEEPDEIFKQV